ncbi:MAG: cyclic nucleotide-binding domain-containing protein [Myxococcales bacterium]
MAELEGIEVFAGADRLQKLPLFGTLSYDETNALASIATQEKRAKGSVVVEEEALGLALYVVVQGRARVERSSQEGVDVIGTVEEGELFGEMSLVEDLFTSARVVAETDLELIAIPRRPFEKLIEGNDRLALKVYKAFCRTLSDRLRKANALLSAKPGVISPIT